MHISAKHKLGIDILKNTILELIGFKSEESHEIFSARTRHLDAINIAINNLTFTYNTTKNLELLAESVRYAHNALGTIVGTFSTEDLLGEIFSNFCIGK